MTLVVIKVCKIPFNLHCELFALIFFLNSFKCNKTRLMNVMGWMMNERIDAIKYAACKKRFSFKKIKKLFLKV